jgi:hypothetical protein
MKTKTPTTTRRASTARADPKVAMTGTLTVTVGVSPSIPGMTTEMFRIGCNSLTSGTEVVGVILGGASVVDVTIATVDGAGVVVVDVTNAGVGLGVVVGTDVVVTNDGSGPDGWEPIGRPSSS